MTLLICIRKSVFFFFWPNAVQVGLLIFSREMAHDNDHDVFAHVSSRHFRIWSSILNPLLFNPPPQKKTGRIWLHSLLLGFSLLNKYRYKYKPLVTFQYKRGRCVYALYVVFGAVCSAVNELINFAI